MNDINALSFEQAYQQLEHIIEQMNSGELPLEETVALYEKGHILARRCQELLDNATLRIKKIDDSGTIHDTL